MEQAKEMRFGDKFNDFVLNTADAEFLEGTTASGKTTVGLYKFILMVATSPMKHHILAALDKGTLEKNLINKDHGIMEEWGGVCEYYGNGRGNDTLPHIVLKAPAGEKIIYCLGYGDSSKWKKALGGQYGCLFIDEINVADIEFVREAAMRADYIIGTLNPDDPALPVYEEFVNRARPLDEWEAETPAELLEMLDAPQQDGWTHWYFNFDDNIALTDEKKERIIRNVPVGTKLYKNKIQGLRGRSTGLVFANLTGENIVKEQLIKDDLKHGLIAFKRLVIGVDTAYSSKSPDTITFILDGITTDGWLYQLEEKVFNNAERKEPLAPSDTIRELVAFADFCRIKWGDLRHIFIDSADQATIKEAEKYKRKNGSIYIFNPAYKGMKILDRINLQLGWIAKGQFLISDSCKESLREYNVYSWKEDKDEPEDRNDHTINASQYAWLPFVDDIGEKETEWDSWTE